MRRSLATAAATLLVALLVGCSGPGAESGGMDSGGGGSVPEPAAPGVPEGAPGGVDTDPDRQVVTTASAFLVVEDPVDGAQRVSELVESVGGRVDERTEQAGSGDDGEGAVADLVVRVPATELTDVLAELKEIGDVENVSVQRSDVTATAVDLDARISALQTSVARLQALMDGAETTEALLAAEKALSDRQEQLESLQSQRAMLADQVDLSTLSVHLEPFGVAPTGGPDGFLEGLGTGWRALVTVLAAAVVVLGVLLPWLAVAGLVTAAVLVPFRLARRRAAVAAPTPPGPPVPPQG
ncbi:MAG TPA: DUF4349 domain-containing protein [Blastococcus sp.]|nr:DUF4349 domain-containing protein [Blastococcus sp.]